MPSPHRVALTLALALAPLTARAADRPLAERLAARVDKQTSTRRGALVAITDRARALRPTLARARNVPRWAPGDLARDGVAEALGNTDQHIAALTAELAGITAGKGSRVEHEAATAALAELVTVRAEIDAAVDEARRQAPALVRSAVQPARRVPLHRPARPLDRSVRVDVSPGPGWAPLDFRRDWSAVAREFGDRAALTLRVGLPIGEAIAEALALGDVAKQGGDARAHVQGGRTKIVSDGLGSLLMVRRNDNVPGFPPGFFAQATRAEGHTRAIDVVVTPNHLYPDDDRQAYAEIIRTTTFPTRRGPYRQSIATRESVIGGVHVVESTQRDRPPGSAEDLVTSISRRVVAPSVPSGGAIALGAR